MLWQESADTERFSVSDAVQDLSFRFRCTAASNEIPVDHAALLQAAISRALPWTTSEPFAAIHSIHGAATGNGWVRPESVPGSMMQLSRRTRLLLRLPKSRLEQARELQNTVIHIGEQEIEIGAAANKPLVACKTLFCRSLVAQNVDEEDRFTDEIASELQQSGVHITKLLCGRAHSLVTADGPVTARSVMLADLSLQDAVTLQQQGYGRHKLFGCGIFLPHKSIAAVGSSQDET